MNRVSLGVEIEPRAMIRQYGGSMVVAIPPSFIESKKIKEPTPCRIFRNNRDQLIIELIDGEPKTE